MESSDYLWPGRRSCEGGNVTLKINECCLEIISDLSPPVHFYTRSSECLKCNFTLQRPAIEPNQTTSFILDTSYPLEFYIKNGKNKLCNNSYSFGDLGIYTWNISNGVCNNIQIKDEPEPTFLNLAVLFSVFLIPFFAYKLYKCALWLHLPRSLVSFQELETDLGNPNARDHNSYIQERTRRKSRVATIDVFRGIAITIMIFVNYGGGGYSIAKHSPWDGLTIADLVFPWFIWLMGVSLALSLRSKLRTFASRKKILCQIAKRSLVLITIGLILNSGAKINGKNLNSWNSLRIPGVLQRIGLTYFVVAVTEVIFMKPQRNEQFGPWNLCSDIVDSAVQWIIALLFVAAHAVITFMLPVPGCPTGYLGPGGWHEHSKYENCTGGAAGYIDRLLLTVHHLYQHPTCEKIYHTKVPYDPEGILGTLTCIFCAFLGVHAGRIILSFDSTAARVKRWLIWGILLGLVGGYLCNFVKNDGYIPVNKNLWSISYVCLTSALAFIIFSVLYLLIDYRRICSGVPFSCAGMNSLTMYIGHEIMKKFLPFSWTPITNLHIELLFMNLNATLIWLFIVYALYVRNIFVVL